MFESQEEYDYAMQAAAEADMHAAAEAAEGEAEQARILAEQEAEARKSVGLSDLLGWRIVKEGEAILKGDLFYNYGNDRFEKVSDYELVGVFKPSNYLVIRKPA